MAANKIMPAVITGNTIVLKPSPYTPLSTVMLSQYAKDAFPRGVVNILSGGDDLGQWMVEHPNIVHISFTGSQRAWFGPFVAQAGTGGRVPQPHALSQGPAQTFSRPAPTE